MPTPRDRAIVRVSQVPPQLARMVDSIPTLFRDSGNGAWRLIEFLTAHIRNPHTREAYARAIQRFSTWCEREGFTLQQLNSVIIAAYVEDISKTLSKPSVKQHLAAIKVLFSYLTTGGVLTSNPAAAVKGPRYSVTTGSTPVLSAEEIRLLIRTIPTNTICGLRDRAIIGTMLFSFARVSAAAGMNVEDYYQQGKRWWFRLREKRGRKHLVPVHHKLVEYVDAYVEAAGIAGQKGTPLFRTVDPHGKLTDRRINRHEVLAAVKRRLRLAGLGTAACNHSFRASGITLYLLNGGALEHAQRIAAHSSPTVTKLYDRTKDEITLDEIERIVI
jgi:integrase/recombinase XerD